MHVHLVRLTLLTALTLCGCREAGSALYDGVSAVAANVETRYAPGYSDAKFREVAVGQSREDVRTLLREPLKEWTLGSSEAWDYSDSPSQGDYWIRRVVFDGTGRVKQVHAELYVD
jgi:outer membrane protein assembly factor BamE (lipoprotein component of BamABCDE complex)